MTTLWSILEKHVKRGDMESWVCNYCSKRRHGHPSRIIAHLIGEPGKNVIICEAISPEEKEKIKREVMTIERREKDDTRQKKGSKKRKSASGSGTSGCDPTEAGFPPAPPGGLNSSIAFSESYSVSAEHSRRLARPVGEAEPDNCSLLRYQVDVINPSLPIWDEPRIGFPDDCTLPSDEGRSHIPIADNPGVEDLENNSNGVDETNDVDSEPNNTMHGGRYCGLDTTQVPSLHGRGDTEMDLGDQIPPPPPPQGNSDCINDERMDPPQCGVGTDAPPLGDAAGVGTAREPGLDDPPPRPPQFTPDLWDFYLKTDGVFKYGLYKSCILFSVDGGDDMLASLASACRHFCNDTSIDLQHHRSTLSTFLLNKSYERLRLAQSRISNIAVKVREEAEQEASIVGAKRKMDMNKWLACASLFKSHVDCWIVDALKDAKLPAEKLLERSFALERGAKKLCEMGNALLTRVPKDILIWNPSFMCCGFGSQQENQTRYPQEVPHGS